MKDYDAYLFDWDGTLISSHPGWLKFFRSELRKHGHDLSDRELGDKIFGRLFDGARELGLSEKETQDLAQASIAAAKDLMIASPLFPDVLEVLKLLDARGKKLGLVTASYREVIDIAIAHHELLEFFDVTVTGDEVKQVKPDPEGIVKVLKTMGVTADRAIMIGDSPKDLLAGQNVGTDTLLFYPPEHELIHPLEKVESCRPTYTVHSWRELLDTLQ